MFVSFLLNLICFSAHFGIVISHLYFVTEVDYTLLIISILLEFESVFIVILYSHRLYRLYLIENLHLSVLRQSTYESVINLEPQRNSRYSTHPSSLSIHTELQYTPLQKLGPLKLYKLVIQMFRLRMTTIVKIFALTSIKSF
jgi:hypothetical protein